MKKKNELLEQLVLDMLPNGLQEWFEVEKYEKTEQIFRITVVEKNIVPALPEKYQGRKIINTIIKPIIIEDFPIRGRKGELIIKRRTWQFEGIKEMLKRDIKITAPGTKLEKEFAAFLKEVGGRIPYAN